MIGAQAGVVDQHVERPEVTPDLPEDSPDLANVPHIEFHGQGVSALSLDFGGQSLKRGEVAGSYCDPSSSGRQRLGKIPTDAFARPGYQRNVTVETEVGIIHSA